MCHDLTEVQAHYDRLSMQHRRLSEDERRSQRYARIELALARHETPTGSTREIAWVNRVRELEAFIKTYGRYPRENNRRSREDFEPGEVRLVEWLKYQRRAATRAHHCEYQTVRLEMIHRFTWEPLERRWFIVRNAYTHFLRAHGRAPAIRSDSAEERKLARWAAKQRLAYRAGTLSPSRYYALAALPIWAWGAARRPDPPRPVPDERRAPLIDLSTLQTVVPVPRVPHEPRQGATQWHFQVGLFVEALTANTTHTTRGRDDGPCCGANG